MNKINKFTTFVAAVAVVLSMGFTTNVQAAENQDQQTLVRVTVKSEYDMYKEFKQKSEEQLLKDGYSKELIDKEKKVDYLKELEKRAKLEVGQLKKMGYTDEQIKIFKNEYKGTEEQVYALSSTLSMSTSLGYHYKSSTYSYASLSTSWTWSSCPVWLEEDVMAIGWTEGMYLDTSYSTAYVDYYDEYSSTYYRTSYGSVSPNLNTGASYRIDMGYHNNDIGGEYAKHGYMAVRVTKAAYVPEMAFEADYGHTQLSAKPSVGFSTSGSASVGISFSWYVSKEASKYIYVSM